MKDLALPLTGGDNRCIRDALGRVVSVPENAEAFAHTMNWHRHLIDGLRGTIEHLKVLRAGRRPGTISYGNADTAVRHVEKLLVLAEKDKLPPAPKEATKTDLAVLIAECGDHDVPEAAADAILAKFKVYPR